MRVKPVRAALLAALLAVPVSAFAQPPQGEPAQVDEPPLREGLWDFSFTTGISTSNSLDRRRNGADEELEIDDSMLFGLRGEAHFTDNVAFALGFTFTRPNYTVKFNDPLLGNQESSDDFAINWIDAELTWRIFDRRSTPYVLGGIAAFNIADEEITPGEFAAEQHWEWHAGAGYEWHLRDHLLVNVGVRYRLAELENWSGNLDFIQGVVGLGYRSGPKKISRW